MNHTPHSTFRIIMTSLVLAAALISAVGGSVGVALAQQGSGIIRISTTGRDEPGCGSEAVPCHTIQYAIDNSTENDTLLVAQGTYRFDPATSADCFDFGITTAVVCVTTHSVTLLGGYSSSNWSLVDPARYPTVIDGENAYRGVIAQNVTLRMEGFTIQNGLAQGDTSGSGYDTTAYGGGLQATNTALTLRHMILKNNRAVGGDLNADIGAAGIGGGLSMNNYASALTSNLLENVVFDGNLAQGGRGNKRGGNAIGGGLHIYKVSVTFRSVTFANNTAEGGPTNGSGEVGWSYADAQGGGAAIYFDSVAIFEGIMVTGNKALGGDAPNGNGGGSFGGGLYFEHANTATLTDALLRGNLAEGGTGNGGAGGLSEGGAIQTDGTNITLDRVSVIANIARGGAGSVKGMVGGGGLAITRVTSNGLPSGTPDPGGNISIVDCVIADNRVEQGSGTPSGGGGGGLWLQGTTGTVSHTTIARNYSASGLYGQGVILIATPLPAVNNLDYVIVADHTANDAADAALYVQHGATVNLNRGLWSGNTRDTNAAGYQPGTFNGLNTMLTGAANFVSPGAPNYDYHIKGSSAARNQATTSNLAVDLDDDSRIVFAPADIGADEYLPIMLTVAPLAGGQLRLTWKPDGWLASTTHHYTISFTKEGGAVNPLEGASPINAGTAGSLTLTGLTNYKQYTFTVQARNASNTVLDSSNTVAARPVDHFVFLPVTLR